MKAVKTDIDGVYILEPVVFGDARGYFFESYNQKDFPSEIGDIRFVQDNESKSCYGVVRGCVRDVAVDLRPGSPTFGAHVAFDLSGENHRQLFIPRGFAHGFSVLSEEAVFQYKCDNYYAPDAEGAIAWDDPDLGIDWGIPADKVRLSAKDAAHPTLKEYLEHK